jgi:hypothetical protein
MSERLTDEELDTFERRIGSEFDNEAALTGDELRALLTELRTRRAIDLTAVEVEALDRARQCVARGSYPGDETALAVLDRLIGAKP